MPEVRGSTKQPFYIVRTVLFLGVLLLSGGHTAAAGALPQRPAALRLTPRAAGGGARNVSVSIATVSRVSLGAGVALAAPRLLGKGLAFVAPGLRRIIRFRAEPEPPPPPSLLRRVYHSAAHWARGSWRLENWALVRLWRSQARRDWSSWCLHSLGAPLRLAGRVRRLLPFSGGGGGGGGGWGWPFRRRGRGFGGVGGSGPGGGKALTAEQAARLRELKEELFGEGATKPCGPLEKRGRACGLLLHDLALCRYLRTAGWKMVYPDGNTVKQSVLNTLAWREKRCVKALLLQRRVREAKLRGVLSDDG